MKYIFLLSCFIWVSCLGNYAFAQTEPMYTQYRFNAMVINPAQAGAQNQIDASFLNRWQWVGVPGAPKTMSFSLNAPIKENFGLGLTFVNDLTGPVQNTNVGLNGAYHLPISKKFIFALGLNGMVSNTSVDLNSLTTISKNDENFQQNLTTGINFNTGWGLLLYSKAAYIGVSEPRIFKYGFLNANNTKVNYANHFFVYGGYNKTINEKLELRPSAMVRLAQDAPISVDVNLVTCLYKTLDLGLTYHHTSALGFIIGYEHNDKIYVGYAYDLPINTINKGTYQTHEIALRFKIKDSYKKISNPRYFN
jgi:type IX secretion system PorP/SprF family membrane protein